MRIKKGFVLREVAGQVMAIATGEASENFHGMIKLNDTGKEIWLGVEAGLSEDEIAKNLQEKYEIDFEKAKEDTADFIAKMKEMEFVIDD